MGTGAIRGRCANGPTGTVLMTPCRADVTVAEVKVSRGPTPEPGGRNLGGAARPQGPRAV